jgi:hypothetical protein
MANIEADVYPKLSEPPSIHEVISTMRALGFEEDDDFGRDAAEVTGRLAMRWQQLDGKTKLTFGFKFEADGYDETKHLGDLAAAVYSVLYAPRARELIVARLVEAELEAGIGSAKNGG